MAHDLIVDPSGNIVISTGYTLGQLAAGIHSESTATNISGAVSTLDFAGKAVLLHTVTGNLTGSYTFPPTGLPALTQNSTRSVLYIEYTQDATGGWDIPLATLFANATSVIGNPAVDVAIGGKTRVKIIVKRIGGVLSYHAEFLPVHVHANISVATENSLTGGGDLSASRTLSLVNDTTTPGNHKYYKTDAAGARGWQSVNVQDIENITVTSPAIDQVLTYNGTIWVNAAQTGGVGGTASEVVESQAALTAIVAPSDGMLVNVRGHTLKGDGGGGQYIWVAAEPDNQMLATAVVAVGGTGYAVGDIFYIPYVPDTSTSETSRAIIRVTSISGTAVTGIEILFTGRYVTTLGTSGVATNGSTGTGCTVNITWVSHSDYGTKIPTNAGGVGRWMRIMDASGRVSVKAFGAKGDNTTNDWQALQRAIWSDHNLYVPQGTYLSNKPLTWFGLRQLDIKGSGKEGNRSSRIAQNYSSEEPLLHKFGRYMKADGSYFFETGYEVGGSNLAGVEDKLVLRDMKLQADKSIWSACCEINLAKDCFFKNVLFRGRFRGLTLGQAVFDTSIIGCNFTSDFMGYFPWAETTGGESNQVIARRAWGLYISGHAFVSGASVVGNGCGIRATGIGSTIEGARIEINNYGMILSDSIYNLGQVDSSIVSRSSFNGVSFEANTIGLRIENIKDSSLSDIGIQGSPADVPNSRPAGEIGLHVLNKYSTATIINGSANGTFTKGAIVNESRYGIDNFTASGTVVNYAKANSVFGQTGTNAASYRLIGYRNGDGPITAFSDQMHTSLTALNLKDGLVKSKNLGDVVTLATSATSASVSFNSAIAISSYSINVISASGSGTTLSTGTYYYATTIIGKTGETGIDYNNTNDHGHKSVVVTAGQQVSITFNGGTIAGHKRRIYRTKVNDPGNFGGFWQQDNTGSSFTDTNQAFDVKAMPPIVGGIPSCQEVDANYQIVATPSWGTTVYVTNKTTTGFTLNFGTAAPAGQTCSWLMFRP